MTSRLRTREDRKAWPRWRRRSARRPLPSSTPRKPEKSSSSRSRRRPSPTFREACLRTLRTVSSWSISATTTRSFATAESTRSNGVMLDSQWVAQQIGRPVVKAFNNIFAKSLLERGVPKGTAGRLALSVAGDSPGARAAVLRLVDDLGFDPVDAGELDNSWRQQTGTPAYCQDLDATALRRALAEADRSPDRRIPPPRRKLA